MRIKSENIDINIEGISVKSAKKVIYFLFDLDNSTSISFFIDFLISKKTNPKKIVVR